ncbi:hypothetical protein ACFLSG_00395, partial [Candidatus Bipolaricaulota bacterium]
KQLYTDIQTLRRLTTRTLLQVEAHSLPGRGASSDVAKTCPCARAYFLNLKFARLSGRNRKQTQCETCSLRKLVEREFANGFAGFFEIRHGTM